MQENLDALTRIVNRGHKDDKLNESFLQLRLKADTPIKRIFTDLDGCYKKRLSMRIHPLSNTKKYVYPHVSAYQDSNEYSHKYSRRASRNKAYHNPITSSLIFSMRNDSQLHSFDK